MAADHEVKREQELDCPKLSTPSGTASSLEGCCLAY